VRRQQNKAFKSWRNVRLGLETSLSPEILYAGTKNGFVVPVVTYSGTRNYFLALEIIYDGSKKAFGLLA